MAIDWALLDPGTDLVAEAIRGLFPVASGTSAIGGASTVLSSMLGTFSAISGTVMLAMVLYNVLVKSVHSAENGVIREGQALWWTPMRITLAAVLLFPLPSGYNAGQAVVTQVAVAGVGLASHLATAALQQVGPAAQTIATPMIPGTKRTVSALMQNELCRALVNAATGNNRMVPEPAPISGTNANGYGYVTWSYDLSQGNATGTPVCGSVTVRTQSGATLSAGTADMSAVQRDTVQAVLEASIRPAATAAAAGLWATHRADSLNGMLGTLTAASVDYTARLQSQATAVTSQLRAQFTADQMRQGNLGTNTGTMRMADAGFFGLGAYYMEMGRLNGFTLSLVGAMPQVSAPSYQGLGYYLSTDLAPLIHAVQAFQGNLDAYIATSDPLNAPGGGAEVFAGAAPQAAGAGVLETVLRKIDFSENLLRLFVNNLAPAQANWSDPFSALMRLGNDMASLALIALGSAVALSSTPVAAGMAAFNVLTFNFAGAAATLTASTLMNFLAKPIFYVLMSLLIPGLTLAFVVPMIPLIMWTMGILGFIIRVFEAIIAAPLWLLAHVTMDGTGLHGRGVRGWGNLLSLFLTPALMVIGMFGSYWAFAFISRLIFLTFSIAAGFTLAQGWLVANMAGVLVLFSMFVLLHIVTEVQCFRLITLVSVHVPSWLGIDSTDRMDANALTQEASMVGMGATLAAIRNGAMATSKQLGSGKPNDAQPAPAKQLGMDRAVAAATDTGPVSRGSQSGGEEG